MIAHWIELENKSDHRGGLLVAEAQKNIPFEIKRVYCLFDTAQESRGFHAHKKLQQVVICVAGNCEIILDDGINRESIKLTSNSRGLFIGNMTWREIYNFSTDCVLVVLASAWYDELDYIRDYTEFKMLSRRVR